MKVSYHYIYITLWIPIMGTHFNKNKNFQRIMHSLDMTSVLFLPSTTAIIQPKHTCFPTAD